ncbi:unnamed protein product [Mytilus coruscus]|uniref:Core-binding (CB) domain-containing protein n=1 Tax=Mytilus coruscus TaxID=42192 RepID=A0A6J8BS92_MYTCO|nr:unnamed protein product [Mytilus coruscus]
MSVARKGERFMKHVQLKSVSNEVNKDCELSSDTRHNVLSELFSEDIASNNDKGSVGLIMDQAQVTILENSWRCQHPEKLSAYREEYRSCFPVHDSAMEFLQVPSLDDLLEPMMRKNHGPKAVKSLDTGHRQLHTQPLKQIEKLSFQGQMASRMNVISGMYMQQTMGTLLGKLENSPSLEHEEKESCCQIVKDLFAMSTKSLDQSGRTGAFFHLVRRKAASYDSGLVTLPDIKDKTQYLPLSGEGVFGNGLKSCLEKRKEQKDQLNDLLPELGQGRKRRADFDRDWQNKNPKFNVEHNAVNASKTRGSNNNRFNVPKTSNRGDSHKETIKAIRVLLKSQIGTRPTRLVRVAGGLFGSPERTTVDSKFLEASQQKYVGTCSIDTTSEIPSFMVEKFSQHAERPIFTIAKNQCDHNDRCFNDRLWGSYGKTDFSGSLEFGTETFAHKLFGNESCNFDSSAFSENFEGKMCSDKEQQHKRSTIHKSSRGDEVTKFMLLDFGAMADSNSKQYILESSPHYGQEECFSGSFESGKGLSDRMVSEQVYSAADFSDMGNPIDRFVCIMGKSPDRNLLHLDSSSQCFGLGCSDNSLGEHVRVCVSPNLSDSKDIAIYEAVPLSDNFDCAPVAKETLVHQDFAVTDSLSNKTTSNGQFVVSGQNENFSSKSRNIKSDSMASFDRHFKTEGFSQSARTLLSASWRDGTKKDYSSKFEKFNSWCGERQIDPYSANLNQVADFLAYLFHSGLQYRTIAGYRSMLSAVLPPVQNFPVGQHPNIVRIIKGVFNSRPPKVKILPEWNLKLLLQALEKKPFEPMQEVD